MGNTKKGTFQDFRDRLESVGMLEGLTEAQICRMAHDAGFETPSLATAEITPYKSQKAKEATLYADCKGMVNGRSDTKLGFSRVSNLKLDAQKAKLHAEALEALVSQIQEGNPDLPKGWAITGETETGFSVVQLKA